MIPILLCGGFADGQRIECERMPPPIWRVVVPLPAPALSECCGEGDPELISTTVTIDYYMTGSVSARGELMYLSEDRLEEVRAIVRCTGQTIEQLIDALWRSCEARLGATLPGAAQMSGKNPYPWDEITREQVQELVSKIDEVTDGE